MTDLLTHGLAAMAGATIATLVLACCALASRADDDMENDRWRP
jgi:hypothetical protein